MYEVNRKQVEILRERGLKVHIKHTKATEDHPLVDHQNGLLPALARTSVYLKDVENGWAVEGHASCSVEDNFCRARGIQVALGRAFKALRDVLPREERRTLLSIES